MSFGYLIKPLIYVFEIPINKVIRIYVAFPDHTFILRGIESKNVGKTYFGIDFSCIFIGVYQIGAY